MVDKVDVEAAFLYLFHGEIAGELVEDSAYHFHMGQFLSADVGKDSLHLSAGRCIALVEVTERCPELAVGSAEHL